MTIWCKHVHGLELQKFLKRRDEIRVFLITDMHVRNKKSGISSLYLT